MRNYIKEKIKKSIEKIKVNPNDYRSFFTNPDKDFTRNRKLTLSSMVRTMVLSAGENLNQLLRNTFSIGERPSSSAFIQQRDKLTLGFYNKFFKNCNNSYKPSTLFKNKFLVVACDGTDINLYPDMADTETAVSLSNNPYNKSCHQVHLNAICSVPDGYFLDYFIQDYKNKNEVEACRTMLENLKNNNVYKNIIITCDRGYESYYLMMYAASLGFQFCIRVKDVTVKSGIAHRYMDYCDEDGLIDSFITRKYTRCQFVNRQKDKYPDYIAVPKGSFNPFIPNSPLKRGRIRNSNKSFNVPFYEFSFRIVRLKLDNGSYETILTNLTKDEASSNDLKELYHMRWGIETAFRKLKYYDSCTFMRTKKKIPALGEIIISLIFHNICTEILLSYTLSRTKKSKSHMYRYSVSYSDLSKTTRKFFSGRDPTSNVKKLVKELDLTLQPIRNDRSFPRLLSKHSFIPFIYRVA